MSDVKKYAVLIDSDNMSSKYVNIIFDELADKGSVTVRRIYGDWQKCANGWNKDVLLRYSINPVQQFAYTTGKNATDSAMIIDAMDLLYAGNLDGFCIVSSDSDFTRLAVRLREAGKEVIGMGENKTPGAFVNACTSFKMLDSLHEDESDNPSITSIKTIQKAIYDMIDANDDKNKLTHVGEIGSRLSNRYPDFDVRNYGYSKLTIFINDAFSNFEVITDNRQKYVKIKDEALPKDEIKNSIIDMIKKSPNHECNMGLLNKNLKEEIKNFSIKKYGYSKFSSFLKSFGCFKVANGSVTLQEVKKK